MRNAEIDWLRGVAILMVIWDHVGEPFHPWVPPLFRGAHSVIDLFFVLSGYLAARSFLPTLPEFPSAASGWTRLKGTLPAIRSFLGRRFIRLFPMAVLWAVLPWGISWLLGPSRIFGDADAIGREVLAIVTFRYNYAIPFGLSNWLGHYWSLSIQEHFYFVFPFLFVLWTSPRARSWGLFLLIGVVALGVRPLLANPIPQSNPMYWTWDWYASHRRLDGLLAGALLAVLRDGGWGARLSRLPAWAGNIACLTLLTGTFVLCEAFSWEYMIRWGITWAVALGFMTVFLASLRAGFVPRGTWHAKALEHLGSISYGVYLIHVPMWRFVIVQADRWSILRSDSSRFVVTFVLTIAGAEVCFRTLERPMADWALRWFGGRKPFQPSPVQGTMGLNFLPGSVHD